MNTYQISIDAFGESALIVQWPNQVNEAILNDILLFKKKLKKELGNEWALVPAYNSITIISPGNSLDFSDLKPRLLSWYAEKGTNNDSSGFLWKLPVCYDDEFAIDIPNLESNLGLSKADIIRLHTSHQYTVYGIGFLPGFMYLGGLPTVLESNRRNSPRLNVAAGSVGLAGKQTGIYPQGSPGGWNIIGKCPVPMFNVNSSNPCFVQVGDKVQFFAIEKPQYEVLKIQSEVGILNPEKIPLNA